MKLQMSKNSVFAILLRSPWWASLAIAAAVAVVGRALLPGNYAAFAFASAMPFLVIAAIAGWRHFKAPRAAQVARTLDAVRAMSWNVFSNALEEGFQREGYSVVRLDPSSDADFQISKASRSTLVSAKRWKAARIGVASLRELQAARVRREANDCICVATGEVTDTASTFAAQNRIRLMQGPDLVRLLPGAGRGVSVGTTATQAR